MNILICSSLPLDKTTAGLNRLMRMQQALGMHGVNSKIVGRQADLGEKWKEVPLPDGSLAVAYDPSLTCGKGYCNAIRQGAQAADYYRTCLPDLIRKYNVDGVITYHPQGQVVSAIMETAVSNGCFVLADMVELFRMDLYYLSNGTNYQQYLLRKKVLPKIDGIIGISHGWCDWSKQHGIHHVWCPSFGVDRDFRTSPNQTADPFVLTVSGAMSSREVPESYLQSLLVCAKRSINVKLRIVGNAGKKWVERRAMRMIKSNPELERRVEFTGFLSDADLKSTFRNADAFVLLRRDNLESNMLFPTRLPEYMVTGNPVILSEVGCFSRCFKHKEDVFFVHPKNDPNELADAIEYLSENPEKRFQIGQNGRKKMLDSFSLESLGKRLQQFLQETHARTQLLRSKQ